MTEKEITEKFKEHCKLVTFTVDRYYHQYLADDDIIQIGNIGLWKAILNHKPDRGTFATFATTCIRHEINRHFQYQNTQMRKADVCSLDVFTPKAHNSNGDGSESTLHELVGKTDAILEWFDSEAILENLDEKNRVILAGILEGYTQKEIAGVLGCTMQAVNHRVKQIRQTVRKVLGGTA